MKAILAILLILASLQPMPVSACDMHGDAGMAHPAEMPGHMDMDMDMDIEMGMDHDMTNQAEAHGCCAEPDADDEGCERSACLSCVVTVAVVIEPAFLVAAMPASTWSSATEGRLAPSHDAHPYRPPRTHS